MNVRISVPQRVIVDERPARRICLLDDASGRNLNLCIVVDDEVFDRAGEFANAIGDGDALLEEGRKILKGWAASRGWTVV